MAATLGCVYGTIDGRPYEWAWRFESIKAMSRVVIMDVCIDPNGNQRAKARHDRARGAFSLTALALLTLTGCFGPPGSKAGTVTTDLVPDEIADGFLYSGQRLRATVSVEAGHSYEFRASLTSTIGNTAGFDDITGEITGSPLAEPVVFPVDFSTSGSVESATATSFIALSAGWVTIEFVVPSAAQDDTVSDPIEAIRAIISGPTRMMYELLLTDWGFDDNGTSPDDAVALGIGPAGELTGTLTPGDEADYFILQLQAETTYRLTVETTDSVSVRSGSEDRFGQINFGVPTAGGLTIAVTASAGVPGVFDFEAPATEEVLLRLTGTTLDSTSEPSIQYAISVIEIIPEEP